MSRTIWLFMGPPGCGKGTQASRLKREGLCEHLSTGDLLRAAIKSGSELGLKVKSFVDSGSLVPDQVMLELIEDAITSGHLSQTVLDGFPRTIVQGEALVKMLSKSTSVKLGGVFWFKIDSLILVKRAVGRRTCSSCGAIYNIEFKPTKQHGVCDLCGGELTHRKDDTEETIKHRINVYEAETKPLLEFLSGKSELISLDADRPEDSIYGEIIKYIKK